ncbi:phosphate acyltransferase PlsX [Oceanibaculum pacificum]|uniref:Phosphate acyltransferase n=1 Tax=Oceanibaculum pacificum TaxID=580166 RepID=A0A154W8I2_9PROT|nr:phosphate acyltransferase PlsX [Oceanibaculum pacificum]KZD09830.1 phosphate acyltransferase [Oceanibaculum pacificum]
MTARLTLSLDAMGGDNAPEMVIRGAELALERFPDLHFLIFGREEQIAPLIVPGSILAKASEIRNAPDVVGSDAKPSVALRGGRSSSMRLAIDAVRSGDASGVVSAGNTGALMAMAKFVLHTVPGIDRPAIASFFPTQRGESVMLDLGANLECDEENLVQFAIMGDVFARAVLGLQRPSIGLLNVGVEGQKGHEHIRRAATLLRESGMPLDFRGFVEGDDIGAGTVDVIVTDGFTGNVALKTAEGTAKLIGLFLRESFKSSLLSRIGYLLSQPAIKRLRSRVDPRRYNGAMFLGLNGIVIKSHGGTDAFGFANAIGVAADLCMQGFIDRIKDEIQNLTLEASNQKAAAL